MCSRFFQHCSIGNISSGFMVGDTNCKMEKRRFSDLQFFRSVLPPSPDLSWSLQRPFDVLAAVLLNESFEVKRAAPIPIELVMAQSSFSKHVNAHRFILRDPVLDSASVVDVMAELRRREGYTWLE